MIKKLFILTLICLLLPFHVFADEISEQEYVNQLNYRRNRLDLVTKKRQIDEQRSYSYTDIDTTTYTYEAYSQSSTDISTQSLSRSEVKEVTDWYIYKGAIRELSDLEFLALVGDRAGLERVKKIEDQKANMRNLGNIFIGSGLLVMLGGAAMSAGEAIVTAGAIGMTGGFFMNAFNLSPDHYIQPDYAQEKIDEYNIRLKKELGLPLDFN
ncbi:MAG: hypothetical protein ABIA67_04465 [Candidatus Margulisiibacteriota bacterium]